MVADEYRGVPRQKRSTWSIIWRVFKTLVFATSLVVVVAAGVAIWYVTHLLGGASGVANVARSFRDPGKLAFHGKKRLNILCLGIDYNHNDKGVEFTKYARSDTIFVVSLDRHAKSLSVVSVPRDMRVNIQGHGWDKINAAYSQTADGDIALADKTVGDLLGIHIDHTIVIKPYAAQHLVDAIGGVTIDVEKNMNYDDNWGDLHIHLKKGVQHLDGQQAVGYVRFRHDAEGDRGRMRRQRQMMRAILSQLPRLDTLLAMRKVRDAFCKDIQTDLTYGQLVDLALLYSKFDRKEMKTAQLDGPDEYIDGIYYMGQDPAQIRRVSMTLLHSPGDPLPPADIRIEVLNATHVVGVAARLADVLRQEGYQVVHVGDTDVSKTTCLLDHLNDAAAVDTLQKLFISRGISTVQIKRDISSGSLRDDNEPDITVVLGEDCRSLRGLTGQPVKASS